MKRARSAANESARPAKRPRDDIRTVPGIPALPPNGLIVLRVSPLDLIDGDARTCIAWDPSRCVKSGRATIDRILGGSARPADMSAADEAGWEFITGGPHAVRAWEQLQDPFLRHTRAQLGLVYFLQSRVRLWCVDEDDDSSLSDDSSLPDDNGASGSEEVSFGPMDAALEQMRKKIKTDV